MKAEPKTEAEILKTTNRVLDAFSQRNLEELLKFFLPDPHVTLIGASAGEKCIGLENIRSHLKSTFDREDQMVAMELEETVVSEKGDIAWISTAVKTQFEVEGQPVQIYFRSTIIYIKQNDEWLIAQMHNSAPLGGLD